VENRGDDSVKKAPAVLTLAVMFAVGCSKVQTTPVLTEKWDTGQHRTCLYGHGRLFCAPEEVTGFKPPVTPYNIELHREEMLKDPHTDSNSYEIKFTSHTPMDFSAWDCYKTGVGSPAIVCNLKHKPTEEESAAFVKSEKEQKEQNESEEAAYKYLAGLDPATLFAACGRGTTSRGQKSQYSGNYDLREDTKVKYPFAEFKFQYLGTHDNQPSYMLKSAETPNTGDISSWHYWTLDSQIRNHGATLEFIQAMPCLKTAMGLVESGTLINKQQLNAAYEADVAAQRAEQQKEKTAAAQKAVAKAQADLRAELLRECDQFDKENHPVLNQKDTDRYHQKCQDIRSGKLHDLSGGNPLPSWVKP
jgi:hypothetical protein